MDNAQDALKLKFGLVGRHISYSFSRGYFAEKFEKEQLPHTYENFDLESIDAIIPILKNTSNLRGLNVTIPYKESVVPFLDKLSRTAQQIGAVNTIKISKKGKLKGYNTDYYGFKKSIEPHITQTHTKALILGTGGASKAIAFALKKLDISYQFVSRSKSKGVAYTYDNLDEAIIADHTIIINCTPLGTFPNVDDCPTLPYHAVTENHILYDLIYNPKESRFLKYAKLNGAVAINGLTMLKLQAEKAWRIWNKV